MTDTPPPDSIDLAPMVTQVLTDLTREPGVLRTLLYTTDGMLVAWSDGWHRDDAERTAAAVSGVQSLQAGVGPFCGLPDSELVARYAVLDMQAATVLLFAASTHTGVAVAVRGGFADEPVALAVLATTKMIRGLSDVLDARERDTGFQGLGAVPGARERDTDT